MACIYVLKSEKTGKLYVGSSHEDNPLTRLESHNHGRTKSTKFGRPWVIIHEEYFSTYTEARKREIFLKTGQGRKILKERCSEW
ncbi:MAG TPA: GIY-YIG nuclease family protein [Candidatus Woesebacteria bacterium]|nr:GIY-YIG nuclease family protein [Candidatus Woesebacteria bacterium]